MSETELLVLAEVENSVAKELTWFSTEDMGREEEREMESLQQWLKENK